MKKLSNLTPALALLLLTSTLTSCEAVKGVFKAGYYAGIFVVIAVLLLIFWIMSAFRNRKNR